METNIYEQIYYSKNGKSNVTVQVMNQEMDNKSKEIESVEVPLNNGNQASFEDNGSVQILKWNEGGCSYILVGEKNQDNPSEKFTKEQLTKIAESLIQVK